VWVALEGPPRRDDDHHDQQSAGRPPHQRIDRAHHQTAHAQCLVGRSRIVDGKRRNAGCMEV
jgi:hypothetical protein